MDVEEVDPSERLTSHLEFLRAKYQVTPRGAKLYVATLDEAILQSKKGIKKRKFPNDEFPELDLPFRGCVYVGITHRTVKKRFTNHKRGAKSGWAMEHFHSSKFFRECVEPLTTLYGFTHLGPDVKEKLESWVGYALYHAGYWVWGPHAHEDHLKEDGKYKRGYGQFLGKGDFC